MSAPEIAIVEVHGGASDPIEVERFDAFARVFQDASRHDSDSDFWTAAELRSVEADPATRRVRLAAMVDGEVCGCAEVVLPLQDNRHIALVDLAVRPDRRRRGIGTRLLTTVEAVARDDDRGTLIVETAWRSGSADEDPSGGFARRFGYAPAQTVRRADYHVPQTDPVVPSAPGGYAVETHAGTPPEADLADRARLARRMTTDAPLGDLDVGEEDWDEDRVRALDERLVTMGRDRVGAFARHLASGRLVAFTEIQIPQDSPTFAYHQDTLVLREHRGRGLGRLLKLANVVALRSAFPAVRTVRTWNAVENAHMIAVNESLGYVTTGFVREWQKRR